MLNKSVRHEEFPLLQPKIILTRQLLPFEFRQQIWLLWGEGKGFCSSKRIKFLTSTHSLARAFCCFQVFAFLFLSEEFFNSFVCVKREILVEDEVRVRDGKGRAKALARFSHQAHNSTSFPLNDENKNFYKGKTFSFHQQTVRSGWERFALSQMKTFHILISSSLFTRNDNSANVKAFWSRGWLWRKHVKFIKKVVSRNYVRMSERCARSLTNPNFFNA